MSPPPVPVTIPVKVGGGRDYVVAVAPGLLDRVGDEARAAAPAVRRWAVIADETVAHLYADRVRASFGRSAAQPDLYTFPPGEASKTRRTWSVLTDRLIAEGHGRDSGVVALGGGVSGDLGGFVAATFMRGVPVVQVPTSILAMVDSSVGGKTGVDTAAGKNLVGAFHAPVRVVVDPMAASTLTRAQRAEGLAEAAKHGSIVDVEYALGLARDAGPLLTGEVDAVQTMVVRSVAIKAGIVGRDEREAGLREILNFGHTLGHALEAASEFRLSHGEAVALGMVLEARLGERLGLTQAGTAARLAEVLTALELPVERPRGLRAETVLPFLGADKKVRDAQVRCVFLAALGAIRPAEPGWAHVVASDAFAGVLDLA